MTGGSSKGQIGADLMIVVIIIVASAIALPFIYMALSEVNDSIQADSSFSADAKVSIDNTTDNFSSTFDAIFVFFLVGAWIFLLVSTFFIDSHPIFFAISIIIVIAVLIVSISLVNSYVDIMNDSSVAAYEAAFPIMSWCMNHLLIIILAISFTTLISLYAKNQL